MASTICYCCGGTGIINAGTPEEEPCSICYGYGFIDTDEKDDDGSTED